MQIHVGQGVAGDAAIMVQQRGGLGVLRSEFGKGVNKFIILRVHNRRAQPFKQHGVAFAQEAQGFANVPAAYVKPLVFNVFKGVFRLVNAEIAFRLPDVNGAHIVIAVG